MPTSTRRRSRSADGGAGAASQPRSSRRRKAADEDGADAAADADEKKDEGSIPPAADGNGSPQSNKENEERRRAGGGRRRGRSSSSSSAAGRKRSRRSESTQEAAAGLLSMLGGEEAEEDGEKEKEEEAAAAEEGAEEAPAPQDRPTKRRGRGRSARSEDDDEKAKGGAEEDEEGDTKRGDRPAATASAAGIASPIRPVNRAGKPAEAGVISRVYVENFMCHRRLTVDLCRNVNFIHGQNGSGKSAVLAAIQICLGAGAKRTHRARNLKELVRKEAGENCSGAKVRVTLLNRGGDGYRREVYGETITVERCISLRGGFNGYRVLDQEGKEKSRSKKDLDAMLDQLNIQVENPVAVLDQEEAKKFLTGKAEDKYAFFAKATELERLDRTYASMVDKVQGLDETKVRVQNGLATLRENVMRLKAEWEEFRRLDKLEDGVSDLRVELSWALFQEFSSKVDEGAAKLKEFEKKTAKRREDLDKAEAAANINDDEERVLTEKIKQLTEEANEAQAAKVNLEKELKAATAPQKQHERELASVKRETTQAKKRFKAAAKRLQDARNQIKAAAGNAKSEEAKRTARMEKAEKDLAERREKADRHKEAINDSLQKYEEVEPHVELAKQNCEGVNRQLHALRKKIQDLQESSGDNLAVFGQKCKALYKKVEQARKSRKFRGPVVGPIGIHIKISEGKERLAKIAENAIGGGTLDRFIVTNDEDRALLQNLRQEIGCSRECGIFQTHQGARFNVPPSPVEGVETIASVLSIEDDLVFNCLVDNARLDQKALAASKEESEEALLIRRKDGKDEVRGGHIKEVHFLPNGDFWQVKRGYRSMVSNERKLKQTIGIDRTAAVEDAQREAEQLQEELRDLREKEARLLKEHKEHKVRWNRENRALRETDKAIEKLLNTIDEIKGEADSAENVTIDTTELEDDVKAAEEALEQLKEKESEATQAIEDAKPAVAEKKKQVEETSARNEKILADLGSADERLDEFVKSKTQRQGNVEKKKAKVKQAEEVIAKQEKIVADVTEKQNETMAKARLLTWRRDREKEKKERQAEGIKEESTPSEPQDEDLEAIEPMETCKSASAIKAKIERALKQIEREKAKRMLSETDPEVAFQKFHRAKQDLDAKVEQIEAIDDNVNHLIKDAKSRRTRWRQFRAHIADMTNETFDEMLNKKGSSGQLEFDNEAKTLNLIVQKDNSNEMSQTRDVKALSGGERSFTTLALLLALGEHLETPFRVMDEFDVFLDPVARKIALDQMISAAEALGHRQFIFITPQDLSSLHTRPTLKIIKMKNPARDGTGAASQQTLPFQSQ